MKARNGLEYKQHSYDEHVKDGLLDLNFQLLKDDDLPHVMDYLAKHPEIKELNLGFNFLTTQSVKLFATRNLYINNVSFRLNQLGDNAVTEFVKHNKIATIVDFSNTNITSQALIDFVKYNQVIKQVDFSWNLQITDEGAQALLEDKLLTRITLDNFAIDTTLLSKIKDMTRKRESLHVEHKAPLYNYNQTTLVNKINEYLQLQKRPSIKQGYCNGLALLWLYKMQENQEQWFYSIVKKIIHRSSDQLLDIEMDIEKLLAHIEWAQNVKKYTGKSPIQIGSQLFYDPEGRIHQRDMVQILGMQSIFSNAKYGHDGLEYSLDQLKKLFTTHVQDNYMIRLSANHHAIGVFRRHLQYYLYDANYVAGEAKQFDISAFKQLYYEIASRLLFKLDDIDKLKLKIDIARPPRQPSQRQTLAKQKLTIR